MITTILTCLGIGFVVGLIVGVLLGFMVGYDWAAGMVARPLINVPVNEAEKERKVEYGAASATK